MDARPRRRASLLRRVAAPSTSADVAELMVDGAVWAYLLSRRRAYARHVRQGMGDIPMLRTTRCARIAGFCRHRAHVPRCVCALRTCSASLRLRGQHQRAHHDREHDFSESSQGEPRLLPHCAYARAHALMRARSVRSRAGCSPPIACSASSCCIDAAYRVYAAGRECARE